MLNPKPLAVGLDTAFVIDETASGNTEEIWPDKYGRVRSVFIGIGKLNTPAGFGSCKAGPAGRGVISGFARVGDEVVISFLHGDPHAPS